MQGRYFGLTPSPTVTMERRARQDTLWALGDLTPEAADVTKHLRDVEGVNFGDYLQRIRLLPVSYTHLTLPTKA